MSPWIFLRYLLLPAAVITGSLLGGWWNFLVPLVCFGIHPLLGSLTGGHQQKEKENTEHSHLAYRLVALVFVPVLLGTTGWMILRISTETFSLPVLTGMFLSTGIMNGIIGFTLAHEFIHRQNKTDRIAGHLLLIQNNYLHYSIEHVGGHHVYACTDKDPHTARLNETFYHFLVRAVAGTFLNAWRIECRRLIKKNWSITGPRNRMLLFLCLHLLTIVFITVIAGWQSLLFFFLQSGVAITLLHVTNYLQHYGLMRMEKDPGNLEKISGHHAWKTRKGSDGLNLFQLENHADHHMHPNRTYELLSQHDASPEMPTGYSGMILLAFVPPLWFRVMNKKILQLNT